MPPVKYNSTLTREFPEPTASVSSTQLRQAVAAGATEQQSITRSKVMQRPIITGKLISLSHATQGIHEYLQNRKTVTNAVVINFPSMPRDIELARKTEYKVATHFAVPDGLHQYQYTSPLEIPFEFELHASDEEYCDQGPLSLLAVAARLHALAMPIRGTGDVTVSVTTIADQPRTGTDGGKNLESDNASVQITPEKPPYFPVACLLDLIYTGNDSPGISCTGYVKDPSVKLMGPWLRDATGKFYNLPTSAKYSFTFVHRPGHTNKIWPSFNGDQPSYHLGLAVNAYADDIKNRLYNTIGLVQGVDLTYQGFNT